MREKLESLPLVQLREIAKTNGIKGCSSMKKADVIEALLLMSEEKTRQEETGMTKEEEDKLDSGKVADGILEVMPDGYGFIRCENYLPGDNDVYVSPSQIKRFNLKTGDILKGKIRVKTQNEKFGALLMLERINGELPSEAMKRRNFEDLTPIFPDERLSLETDGKNVAMRIFDLVSPIGKGQRGMIVSPPKAGKTTLLKGVASSILKNNPEVYILILLIDERPEEVTDMKESITGDKVEVIYSTFDELPDHHKRVSEMVIERAKRLVEHGRDVVILLDSITRLARAYNLLVPPSGRTLSGGLDPAALHMPKRFFGAARNIREGGSLTILATALVDTGSKMDDVVYEEFKGTGNMELILDRKLQEKRIFPAIDIAKSGTRREDLLLSPEELDAVFIVRKATGGLRADEATEKILDLFVKTRNNAEFVNMIRKIKLL
ncbi:MAG: transcription termination factor Rho [Lachnospiraceae bacterium]|nr:transcription termination factor Rho [Lachnospiraceae bacterium]